MYALNYISFRKVLPACQVSFRRAGTTMLKQMWNYGIHTFVQTVSMMGLNQGPPVLIGHFLPAEYVGFYSLPVRLLQYTTDFVGRIGAVTNVNAAALAAREESQPLVKLAVYANRYCLAAFMPLAILLWTYGDQFFRLWIGPAGAPQAAPLLPPLLIGYLFAVVAQFSSSTLLLGLGKHQRYARGLLTEAVLVLLVLCFVIPRSGILAAAFAVAALMLVNRGIVAPWLVARTLRIGFAHFMQNIYLRPLLAALPSLTIAYVLRATILSGAAWLQIFFAALLIAIPYYAVAFVLCVDPDHKSLFQSWVTNRVTLFASR